MRDRREDHAGQQGTQGRSKGQSVWRKLVWGPRQQQGGRVEWG